MDQVSPVRRLGENWLVTEAATMKGEIGDQYDILKDPFAEMEIAWMEEYLQRSLASLEALPEAEARRLRIAASVYASCKRAEIQAKGHLSHELTVH